MKTPTMYISTCDATMFFLPLFSYFFEKYWTTDTDVKVLGFKQPTFNLPDRFEYLSIAAIQVGGAQGWSTYLRKYFKSIDDEIILWGIDDHLIVDTINEEILEYFIDLMKKDKTIGRVGLTRGISTREYSVVEKRENFSVIELTQEESTNSRFAFRIDCNFGLWRKEYLLKYLKNNRTPWQFEVEGSKLARNDGWRILSTIDNICVAKVEGKRYFAPNKINLLGAKFFDILESIKLNLVSRQNIIGEQDWL